MSCRVSMIQTSKFNSTLKQRPGSCFDITHNWQEVDFVLVLWWNFNVPCGKIGSFCSQIHKTVVLIFLSQGIKTGFRNCYFSTFHTSRAWSESVRAKWFITCRVPSDKPPFRLWFSDTRVWQESESDVIWSQDNSLAFLTSPNMSYPTITPSSEGAMGGFLWVSGISGVKKVGCGCYTGVKWYLEGGAETGSGGLTGTVETTSCEE